MSEIENKNNKFKPHTKLDSFVIHVVDECNLRCWGCDHFAPLAKGGYIKLQTLEKDLTRISQLTNNDVKAICLMGGEPLLHPDLIEILKISRYCLPYTEIVIMTNGILLNRQKDNFWHACNDNRIKIINTKYPIKLDYESISQKAKKFNVMFEIYGDVTHTISYHIPLNLNPADEITGTKNWLECFHANRFRMLKDGKLYPCTIAPNIIHFNKFFNKKIPLHADDGIDIYKATNLQEILNFLACPIPCCKNCDVFGRTFDHLWCRSQKQISEWTR